MSWMPSKMNSGAVGVQVKNRRRVVKWGVYSELVRLVGCVWMGCSSSEACFASLPSPLSLSLGAGRGIVATRIHSHQHHRVQGPRGRERGAATLPPAPAATAQLTPAEKFLAVLFYWRGIKYCCYLVRYFLWPVVCEESGFYFFLFQFCTRLVVMAMLFCMNNWVVMCGTEGSINCVLGFKGALQGGRTAL